MSKENIIKFKPRKDKGILQTPELQGLSNPEIMVMMNQHMKMWHDPSDAGRQFEELLNIHGIIHDETMSIDFFAKFLAEVCEKHGTITIEVLGGPRNEPTVEGFLNGDVPASELLKHATKFLDAMSVPMFRHCTAISFGPAEKHHYFFVQRTADSFKLTSITRVCTMTYVEFKNGQN